MPPANAGRFSQANVSKAESKKLAAEAARRTSLRADAEAGFEEEDDGMGLGVGEKVEVEEQSRRLVDQGWFNGIIMTGIVANALQMGAELQFSEDPWPTVWSACEHFFTAFFLTELCIKLSPLMGWREYFSEKANWLDFVVVIVAVLDNWIFSLIMDGGSEVGFISILRLIRLSRILKLLKAKRELMLLIEGIVSSIRSMFWLSILLGIIVYTVAIVLVKFVGRSDDYEGVRDAFGDFDNKYYFGTLLKAAMTALNLALMVDWTYVARPIMETQPHVFVALGVYVGISCFGIMNAIIGVIVSRTSQAAKEAEEEDQQQFRARQMLFVESIRDIIYEIDTDGDGTVSPEEIEQAQGNEELKECLECIDLPPGFSMLELHGMLDKDGDGELTKAEFGQVAQQKRKLFQLRDEVNEHFKAINAKIDMNHNEIIDLLQTGNIGIGQNTMVSDKIIPDSDAAKVKKGYDASPNEACSAPIGLERRGHGIAQAGAEQLVQMMNASPEGSSPSPVAQATAAALAEVSQALARTAQHWSDDGFYPPPIPYPHMPSPPHSPIGMGGVSDDSLRQASTMPLYPGIVNQHKAQDSNDYQNMGVNARAGSSLPGMMNPQFASQQPEFPNQQNNSNMQGNTQGATQPGNAQQGSSPSRRRQIISSSVL